MAMHRIAPVEIVLGQLKTRGKSIGRRGAGFIKRPLCQIRMQSEKNMQILGTLLYSGVSFA